jgi:branched-chain amino acid transport system substrate-binding protein
MKKSLAVSLVLSLMLGMLTGCKKPAPKAESQSSGVKLEGEILFGVSAAMTGNFPLAGQRTKEGIDLALEEINAAGGVLGKKLVYTIEDDQNTQTTAVNVVTKILTQKVAAVIGPHTSGNAMATQELYKKAQVSYLTGGVSPRLTELGNEYFFRVRPSDTINGQVASKYAIEKLGAKKIGISFNNNDFGTGGRDVIIAYLEKAGIPYVAVGHNAGDKDLTGQIMRLKSEGVDVIISWTDDAEVALTARQLYELGVNVPVIASAGVVMDQVLNLLEPEYVEGWYSVTDFVVASNNPVITTFVNNFKNKYGHVPELYAATYYSAAYVVADAIKRAGSADPKEVRDALAQTKNLSLPEGVYTADGNRNMVHGCVIAQILKKVPTMVEFVEVNE